MSAPLFTRCKPVHTANGRVRFRYASDILFNGDALNRYLSLEEGVEEVRINRAAASIVIRFDPEKITAGALYGKLESLDRNTLGVISDGKIFERGEEEDGTALPLARPVAAMAATPLLPEWLKAPVTLAASAPALASGVGYLFKKGITSEVLEAAAIAISVYRKDYFAANTTNVLIELAEVIEENIDRKSDAMLKSLLVPQVEQVWVERDGREIQLPSDQVKVGDIVVSAAGSTVPVDGTVMDGEALVNQVSMTGESVPVRKVRGDRAVSGTIVEEGRIRIWAEQVGKDTATYRIADYVQSSLESKSSMQLEADKLADSLVPVTLGLSAFTYAVSGDLQRVAAVFQADYSCALKLATPVAFKSSMFQAGQDGILIKGADALERVAEADTFVFDKTGTLTSGDLEVDEIYSLDPEWSQQEVLSLAASIEEHYFHPVAEAVVKAAQACGHCNHFHHSEVEFIVAHGVSAEVEGKKVVIGSRHFLEDDEGICFESQYDFIDQQYKEGKTLLYIGYDNRLLGMLAMKDRVRPEAKETLERLRELGAKELIMLTGDFKERADELAEALGIDQCHSQLLPQEKSGIVEALKAEGKKVVFIGDGINDAPSLAAAHVGVSMQKGADIARVTSDVALLEDRISIVADLKEIGNKAVELVHRNYNVTVGANTAILAGAALGWFSPVATSVLHNGTTVGILLNALRGVKLSANERP